MLGIQYDITTQETRQLKDKKQNAKNNRQYYL